MAKHLIFTIQHILGSWEVRDVTLLNGEPRKLKLKLRMNGHGVFELASATTTEELPPEEDEPVIFPYLKKWDFFDTFYIKNFLNQTNF